jgi:ABC-type branched-subunit amino acid transport system ATPase component/DNA-binding CsgD family transcriptional regulator
MARGSAVRSVALISNSDEKRTHMIEIDGLTKRYGDKAAVDGLSFVVEPGVVTGFLGPNGAGKSTTMRLIAGLDRPTSGTVRVNGKHFPGAAAPMAELGILLDARSVHPGLSARDNLLALARTAGIGRRRVDEVIELAGLAEVAGTRAGGFSLGMGQRLGVAAALLGQPRTVVLLKDTQPASLVAAIRTVAAGDSVLAPTATTRLVRKFAASPRPGPPSIHPSAQAAQLRQALTGREQDVFSRIAAGLSNSEIAASLFLSEGTVKIHVGRILAKLGLRDRVQAVVLAYESRLITPGSPPPDAPGQPH